MSQGDVIPTNQFSLAWSVVIFWIKEVRLLLDIYISSKCRSNTVKHRVQLSTRINTTVPSRYFTSHWGAPHRIWKPLSRSSPISISSNIPSPHTAIIASRAVHTAASSLNQCRHIGRRPCCRIRRWGGRGIFESCPQVERGVSWDIREFCAACKWVLDVGLCCYFMDFVQVLCALTFCLYIWYTSALPVHVLPSLDVHSRKGRYIYCTDSASEIQVVLITSLPKNSETSYVIQMSEDQEQNDGTLR